MNEHERRTALLRLAAGQLAILIGMLHVWLGIQRWSRYAVAGIYVPPEPRVLLWTVSGLLVLVAVPIIALEGIRSRLVYAAGIALSLTYVLGYYAWHLGGHRFPFGTGQKSTHDVDPVQFLIEHTFAGSLELFALVTEVALIVLLAALLWTERPRDT